MRVIWSMTRVARMLFSVQESRRPSSDLSATTSTLFALVLKTEMPCWFTSAGRRGTASCTRFWVCTAAMSGLVPGAKVSVMFTPPLEVELEVKYSIRSSPVSCCSITCVTVRSAVSALAPG